MKRKTPKRRAHAVPRMTDEQLRQFVLDWCDGWVTSSAGVPSNLLANVFLPLALGALGDWKKRELEQVGLIFAVAGKDKSCHWAINGNTIYASCQIMHRDDWARARTAITAELERRKTIKV